MTLLKRQPRAVYTVSDAAHHLQEPVSDAAHHLREPVSAVAHHLQEPVSATAHHLQEPDFVHSDSRFATPSAGVAGRLPAGSHHRGPSRLAAFVLLGIAVVSVTLIVALNVVGPSRRSGAAPPPSYASAARGASLPASQPVGPARSSRPAPDGPAGSSHPAPDVPAGPSHPAHRLATHRTSTSHGTVESVVGFSSQRTAGTIGGASIQASEGSLEAEQQAGNRCPCGAVAEFGFER